VINQMNSKAIPFSTDSIKVEGDLKGFDVQLSTKKLEDGLELVTIKVSSNKAATPPKFSLKWKFPSQDITKFWNPNFGVNKANFYNMNVSSRSTKLAPIITFMNTNDENRFSFAVADALDKLHLSAYIMEEDAYFYCEVVFFDEQSPAITSYETELIIDKRKKPFYNTLSNITDWWAKHDNYHPATPPHDAFLPVYSTWYSYHQNLDVDAVVEECRQSKEMGIKTVIIDDG
jgi:alpha-galactosidase